MKNLAKISLAVISFGFVAMPAMAQDAANNTATFPLKIQLSGLDSEDGMILTCVSTKADYEKMGCDYKAAVALSDLKDDTFTIPNVAPGKYAVRLFHDLNGNMKLDRNAMGIPTEPWAASNNAKGNFGPPKYEDAEITISGATTIKITIE